MNYFRFLSLFAFSISLLALASSAHALTPSRIPIQVNCSCNDAGGRAYLQALHDQLVSNLKFQEVNADASKGEGVIHLDIVSSPLAAESAGGPARTTISIVGKYNGATMEQSVETCNKIPLQASVQVMLETLSSLQ